MHPNRHTILLLIACLCIPLSPALSAAEQQWFKGNLHTHSLWSDGDDYPEMIADWYKQHGYQFLMFTEHNTIAEGARWSVVKTNKGGMAAFEKYKAKFGTDWVREREEKDALQVQLRTLQDFRKLFEDPGKFLLIRGEEITARHLTSPVHINATNLRTLIKPTSGDTVLEVIRANVNAVVEQRKKTGQPMFPHVNHPNFGWAITAEELMQVENEKFFEVYNGHPTVHNQGDKTHAGTERVWDIILTRRLAELHLPVMYGLGTDDSHNYHEIKVGKSNSGRGWVMVRTDKLAPDNIVAAMEVGDFYASSGVRLKDVRATKDGIEIEIDAEPGVSYTTQFIGTRKGYDPANEPALAAGGQPLRVSHHYSADIGAVLSEQGGTTASYTFKGDEIYVRARITSSKLKDNPSEVGEFERAWTQPVIPPMNR